MKGEERKMKDTTAPKAAQHSTAQHSTQQNTTQKNRKDEDNDCWDCSRGSGSDNGEWTEV